MHEIGHTPEKITMTSKTTSDELDRDYIRCQHGVIKDYTPNYDAKRVNSDLRLKSWQLQASSLLARSGCVFFKNDIRFCLCNLLKFPLDLTERNSCLKARAPRSRPG